MAIDRFTKEQFEAALPVRKDTGARLWELASQDREFVYRMHIGGDVYILIRSSVQMDGFAADTACDSIRCWLGHIDGSPLGNKLQAYVTRVKGWDVRLVDLLKRLWILGKKIVDPCTRCNVQKNVFLCKKEGANKGRHFVKCPSCGSFEWLDAPKEAKVA